MSKQAAALAMATTCILAMWFQSGLAQFQIPGLNIPPLGPGGGGGSSGDAVLKCWSSVGKTEGCVMSIYSSIFNLNFNTIAPSCCQAYLAIDSGCPSIMFPWNPFFPQLIKDFCTRIVPDGGRGGAGVPPVNA